jgi:LysM repeat protein/ABC-type branched-subunit amino acid transport system substrate-binding protein
MTNEISHTRIKSKTLVLLFVLWLGCLTSALAQTKGPLEERNGIPYYKHKVEKGQTLYSLSKFYKCDINDILSSNPGLDQGLKEGAEVWIPAEKSDGGKSKSQTISGQTYLTHVVEKKETLFSISQRYNVDINAIVAANPGLDAGLKKGQEIKIPVKPALPKIEIREDFVRHEVKSGETLFGISKLYNVTPDEIKAVNAGLNESLSLGQIMVIPVVAKAEPVVMPKADPKLVLKGPSKEESYTVALCLPFFTDLPDSVGLSEKERRQRDVAINIYRGAKLAADQLEREGLNAELNVYNIGDEKKHATALIKKPEFKSTDLLIGPTFRDPMNEFAAWAATEDVHMVCPIPASSKLLLSSSHISKTVPGSATQWDVLGKEIARKYPGANVMVINSTVLEEVRGTQVFYDAYLKAAGDSAHLVKAVNRSVASIASVLSAKKQNIVVCPSSDRAVVGTLFKALNQPNTIVYGPEEWENLDLISAEARNAFQVHFLRPNWIDYSNPAVQEWIESYRKKYKSEPTEYAFIGYDILLYYGRGLIQFGKLFPDHFSEIKQEGLLTSKFKFLRTGAESGFENEGLFILGTRDFELFSDY